MSYLSVITLAQAKMYLKIDEGQDETDAEITSMIKGALSFIEKRTNHIMFARDKEYFGEYFGTCHINVYDYPINDPLPIDNIRLIYSTYSRFSINNSVSLNVGYINPLDVPEELIQSALQIIEIWYYSSEKRVNTMLIPESVMIALDVNKRFL